MKQQNSLLTETAFRYLTSVDQKIIDPLANL